MLSDIDIGVLVDQSRLAELEAQLPWGYQASLAAELMQLSGRNDVDLVLLHRASPLLAYEVVRRGKLLLCRDERRRVDFEIHVHQEYLDTKPLRDIKRSYLYEAIAEGRFGRRRVVR